MSRQGEIRYFSSKEDNTQFIEAIQASHAVPLLAKKIIIDDVRYHDSFAVSSVYTHIRRAFEHHKVDKVIVIDCLAFLTEILQKETQIHRFISGKKFSEKIKSHNDHLINEYNYWSQPQTNRPIFVINPSQKTDITSFTVDGEKLWQRFQEGKQDGIDKKDELATFLHT